MFARVVFSGLLLVVAAMTISACGAPDTWNPADPTTGESVENRLIQCLIIGPACTGHAAAAPNSLTNLALWLKADALVLIDGASVTSWVDSSGGNNTASQGTAANAPTFTTGVLNGLPAVRFTASSAHYLTTPEFMDSPSVTIFQVVGNVVSTGADQRLFNDRGVNSSEWIYPRINTSDEFDFRARDSAGTSISLATPRVGSFAVFTSQVVGPSILLAQNGLDQARVNGSYSTLTTWQGTTGPPTIGGNSSSPTNNSLNGDIAEIIVFKQALTELERRGVQCYLSAKYGISLAHACAAF